MYKISGRFLNNLLHSSRDAVTAHCEIRVNVTAQICTFLTGAVIDLTHRIKNPKHF